MLALLFSLAVWAAAFTAVWRSYRAKLPLCFVLALVVLGLLLLDLTDALRVLDSATRAHADATARLLDRGVGARFGIVAVAGLGFWLCGREAAKLHPESERVKELRAASTPFILIAVLQAVLVALVVLVEQSAS